MEAKNAGNITQSGAISSSNLTVTTNTGNATLNNTSNNATTLTANSTSGTISYTDTNSFDVKASNLGTGDLTLETKNAGNITQSGAILTNDLKVTTDTGNATLTNASNDADTFQGTSNSGTISYTDTDDFDLKASNTGTGSLTLEAKNSGNITQSAAITTDNLTVKTATGNATLNNASNNATTLTANSTSGTINYTDTNSFDVKASNLGTGDLTLEAKNAGNISQSGAIVANDLVATVDTGGIVLNESTNNVDTAKFTANNGSVSMKNADGLTLKASDVGTGTLTVEAASVADGNLVVAGKLSGNNINLYARNNVGSITQSAEIVATNLTAETLADDIVLTHANNDVTNVSLYADSADILYTDTNDFNVTKAHALFGGSVTLEAKNAGNITQSGTILGTNLTVTTNTGNATLTTATNDVDTFKATSTSGNVSYTDADDVAIQATNTGTGDLTLEAKNAGNITQSGAIVTDDLTVTTATGNVTLTNASNNAATLTANSSGNGTVNYVDTNHLSLKASNVGTGTFTADVRNAGNLSVDGAVTANVLNLKSASGNITQSVAIGNATLNVTTGSGTATLNNVANDVDDLSATSTNGVVNYTDADGLNLTASNLGTGNLNVTLQGASNLTQSGALVGNQVSVTAGSGNVTLTNAANDMSRFTGSTTGDITVVDTDDLQLGASAGSAKLKATAGGTLSTAGNLSSGTVDLTATAGGIQLNDDVTATTTAAFDAQGAGTIVQTNGKLINATTANFKSGSGDIGQVANYLDVNASNIGANTTGGVYINGVHAGGTNLTASTVGGSMNVSSTNALTTSGAISAGSLSLAATNGGMNLNSNVAVTGTANLSTSNGGNISQVNGNQLTANAANFNASGNVGSGGNAFDMDVNSATVNAANAYLNDTDDLAVGASTLSGLFNLTTGNTLSTTGAITANDINWVASAGGIAMGSNVTGTTAASLQAMGAGTITQTNGFMLTTNGLLTLLSGSGDIGQALNYLDVTAGSLSPSTTGGIYITNWASFTPPPPPPPPTTTTDPLASMSQTAQDSMPYLNYWEQEPLLLGNPMAHAPQSLVLLTPLVSENFTLFIGKDGQGNYVPLSSGSVLEVHQPFSNVLVDYNRFPILMSDLSNLILEYKLPGLNAEGMDNMVQEYQ